MAVESPFFEPPREMKTSLRDRGKIKNKGLVRVIERFEKPGARDIGIPMYFLNKVLNFAWVESEEISGNCTG